MLPVTAIFDIGRTNKKFFLFDDSFREVHREYVSLPMIEDEDGYPCEDIDNLVDWMRSVFHRVMTEGEYAVKALNFSSYGASLVHLDVHGRVVAPLYNYTKPLPAGLTEDFFNTYGPREDFLVRTASDDAGMLNSGMQLYWLKHRKPEVFSRIRYSLHLPQFLSYRFTGIPVSEYTSIGCHTFLWDYPSQDYHPWVYAEGLDKLFPKTVPADTTITGEFYGKRVTVGVGIHDSSAALLPYLKTADEPFMLLSTGTWSVALNPFISGKLEARDMAAGCINYLRPDGQPVRAARLFLGEEYKRQTRKLADHFGDEAPAPDRVFFNTQVFRRLKNDFSPWFGWEVLSGGTSPSLNLPPETSYVEAYHHLMMELATLQAASIRAAIGEEQIGKLFIDGGFSDNEVFVNLLAHDFRGMKIRTTDASLGSALGAAISIAEGDLPDDFLTNNYGLREHQPFPSAPNRRP
ncbi:FGGY-family carbohydrate kinase [Lewinella sp. W8]|uniref:FGGY-family carbohydrate kinase n=1 Tax=Lewinella sp. W8 TaxID=2528208 RepID=UPI0010671ECD|nr:FGGY family carbohydrate kinase [Lewinella sp. W8]MTB50354.1 carbohydrate kinase [Lewinella sp. W8]